MENTGPASKVDLYSIKESNAPARARFEIAVGWRYGLLFGLGVVLVGWGVDAAELFYESAALFWPKLLLGLVIIVPLCALAGLLAGRAHGMFLRRLLIWLVAGALMGVIAIHLSFEGVSAVAALIDPATRGIDLYPFPPTGQDRVVGVAIFGAVAAILVGALQNLAAAWAWDSSTRDDRMTLGGWIVLLISLPLAIGLGGIYDGAANSQLRAPLYLTNRVIQLALSTPPDLDYKTLNTFQLFDYLSTARWRSGFTPHFTQHLADYDHATLRTGFVDAQFESGLIWRCRVQRDGENLAGCSDVRADYTEWIKRFFATGSPGCNDCSVRIEPATADWQLRSRAELGDPQQITVEHHLGGVVLVRARVANGSQVECRLYGADPVVIQQCETKK